MPNTSEIKYEAVKFINVSITKLCLMCHNLFLSPSFKNNFTNSSFCCYVLQNDH